MPQHLPPGISKLSEIYQIRGFTIESGPAVYTESSIDTGIDAVSRELLAIWYAGLELSAPDPVAPGPGIATIALNTAQLVMRTKATLVTLNDFDLIAKSVLALATGGDAGAGSFGAGFTPIENPVGGMLQFGDFPLAFVTSRQMFLGIIGSGNINPMSVAMRLYVQRVKASADVYAALIGARNA